MTDTKPVTDFVEIVATMGHPIMDIPTDRLRRLVAMTFLTEFRNDSSVKYEDIKNDILGIMTENAGDIQKQITAALEAKQKKTGQDMYAALRPLILKVATDLDTSDRPLTFTVMFDYNMAKKNLDGSPMMVKSEDGTETEVREPDMDFRIQWTSDPTKKKSEGRTGSYQGRVAGSYTFPDSKNDDGTLKQWGSMRKFATEVKGYKEADGLPRTFLSKWYDIPNRPNDKDGDTDLFVSTLKAAA